MLIIWALAVTLSFFGWGAVLLRLLGLRDQPFVFTGAAGVTALVSIGGPLNLAHLLVIRVIQGVVLAGVVFFGVDLFARRRRLSSLLAEASSVARKNSLAGVCVVILCFAISAFCAIGLHHRVFNGDDLDAYLPLPLRTAELGTLPDDPFSERRVTSSLGGNLYLQELMLPVGDMRSVAFIDTGFGYLLLTLAAYSLARAFRWSRDKALALAALAIALPFLRINLQMSALPEALFVVCMLIALKANGWKDAVLLGATGAAIASLKQNFIVALGMILLLYLIIRLRTESWKTVSAFTLFSGAAFFVTLFPWMADSRIKAGTYFYPLLGRGFHATSYPGFAALELHPANMWTALSIAPLFLPLAVLFVLVLKEPGVSDKHPREFACLLAFIGGVAGATAAVGYATAGDSVGRYCLPFIYPACLGLIAFILSPWRQNAGAHRRWSLMGATTAAWMAFLFAYYGFVQVYGDYREYPADVRALFSDHVKTVTRDRFVLTGAVMKQYAANASRWQTAVPRGSTILAAVGPAIGLDFIRNPVYIADWPGMAGLPPGLPFNRPAGMKAYLESNRIRYVAFADDGDYREALKFAAQSLGRRLLVRRQAIARASTLLAFEELRQKSDTVYDNGGICVIRVY